MFHFSRSQKDLAEFVSQGLMFAAPLENQHSLQEVICEQFERRLILKSNPV